MSKKLPKKLPVFRAKSSEEFGKLLEGLPPQGEPFSMVMNFGKKPKFSPKALLTAVKPGDGMSITLPDRIIHLRVERIDRKKP
jgi:hypothetical protein